MPISSFMHIGLKLRGAQQKFVNNCGVKNSDGTQAYIVFQMNWSCTMHLNCFSKKKLCQLTYLMHLDLAELECATSDFAELQAIGCKRKSCKWCSSNLELDFID